VEPAHRGVEGLVRGEPERVAADVDDPGVAAAGHHDQALVPYVDDDGLVVQDQGIRLPAAAQPRLLRREARLVAGDSRDLAGDQHRAVEQETGLSRLHDVEPGVLQRPPADARDLQRFGAGQHHPAPPPEVRVDEHRHVRPAHRGDQAVDAGGVVEMAVAADDGFDRARIDVQPPHVLDDTARAGTGVEQQPVMAPALVHRDEHGESVLGDERVGCQAAHHDRA
jgi:hypothetical protein